MTQTGGNDRVSQGGEGHIVRAFRITMAWLIANWGRTGSWQTYRKRTLTSAITFGPLGQPHVIATKEGDYHLAKGWEGVIAIDADGDPYPIERGVFEQTYERADR